MGIAIGENLGKLGGPQLPYQKSQEISGPGSRAYLDGAPDPRGPTSKGRGRIGRRKGRERERKPMGGEGTRPTPSRSP